MVVFHPFDKKSFLPNSLLSFDNQRQVLLLGVMRLGKPLLDLNKIFFKSECFLILVKLYEDV